MYPYPNHPEQLLRLAQNRLDEAYLTAERARLAPSPRHRLASALRTLAARLEPDLTPAHDEPSVLNHS